MKNESLWEIIYFSNSVQVNLLRNYFILLVTVCLCYELVGILIMYITSSLYQCVNDNNWKLFRRNLFLSFLCILIQAFLSSFKYYLRDGCGLVMREMVVLVCNNRLCSMTNDRSYLFSNLIQLTSSTSSASTMNSRISSSVCSSFLNCFSVFTSSTSVNSSNEIISKETENLIGKVSAAASSIANIDQRITNDVNDFIENFLKILEKVMILPFLLLFYICYLCYYISWFSPFLCFGYFLLSGCLCHFLTLSLIPLKVQQSTLEGNFHFLIIHFLLSFENILLCFGGKIEKKRLRGLLEEVLENKRMIIKKEWILSYCICLFDYGSTTICYLIVGVSLLLSTSSSSSASPSSTSSISSSRRILLWSRGIYASLALINGLSLIIDSLQWYSLMKASQQRIEEFFTKTSHSSDVIQASSSSVPTGSMMQGETRCLSSSAVPVPTSAFAFFLSSRNDVRDNAYIQLKNFSEHDSELSSTTSRGARNDLEEQLLSHRETTNPRDLSVEQNAVNYDYSDFVDEFLFCSICQHSPLPPNHDLHNARVSASTPALAFHIEFPMFDLYTKDKKKLLIKSLQFPSLSSKKPFRLLITGATGCGKSTLLKTVSTKILEDTMRETKEMKMKMKMMMYCPQQPYFLLKVS
jgi:ABC-type multidrug transport system fused ATPase/permease subunit